MEASFYLLIFHLCIAFCNISTRCHTCFHCVRANATSSSQQTGRLRLTITTRRTNQFCRYGILKWGLRPFHVLSLKGWQPLGVSSYCTSSVQYISAVSGCLGRRFIPTAPGDSRGALAPGGAPVPQHEESDNHKRYRRCSIGLNPEVGGRPNATR